jgi:hypothetical protein
MGWLVSVRSTYSTLGADGLLSESRPIYDAQGRIIACLAGQPSDVTYAKAADAAYRSITLQGEMAKFKPSELQHLRGHFPVVRVGVTHGNGTKFPVNLDSQGHTAAAQWLLNDRSIQRLASFASGEPILFLTTA